MEGNKLRKKLNIILAVILLAFVVVFGAMTLVTSGSDLWDSARLMTRLRPYLPENYNALDLIAARVQSVKGKLGTSLWQSDALTLVSTRFQHTLGKNQFNIGAADMIRLKNGALYDIHGAFDVQKHIDVLSSVPETFLTEGTPYLFAYAHPSLYDESLLPAGYDDLDKTDDMADLFIEGMRSAGVNTIDSREVLLNSGLPLDELLWKTDQHWTPLAALTMAQEIARHVEEMSGVDLDLDRLDLENFETEVHPDLLLGEYGQRVGVVPWVDLDDVVLYLPAYETYIERYTVASGGEGVTTAEGSFREAIIRDEMLAPNKQGVAIDGYQAYGLADKYEVFHNPNGADITILVAKDSFCVPVCNFLSLVAKDVYTVDLRWPYEPFSETVARVDPDIVIFGYSQNLLRDNSYILE